MVRATEIGSDNSNPGLSLKLLAAKLKCHWSLPSAGDGAAESANADCGVLGVASFTVFVWALSFNPVANITAFRECSVLFSTLIGVTVLREPFVIQEAGQRGSHFGRLDRNCSSEMMGEQKVMTTAAYLTVPPVSDEAVCARGGERREAPDEVSQSIKRLHVVPTSDERCSCSLISALLGA
ncbi:hypothetical protein [Bradyrhizobium sp. ARR65]|uniref:hypothetical protein n=1 Tax=Bradyrhizobium sp. ARR65 TaxID=1040989 RepID=UPI0012F852BE|nr:hypothetical protein [Bradyrhizobium sp. ARR65]